VPAGNRPRELVRIELRQHRERHGDGDAIVIGARVEDVGQWQLRSELVGIARGREVLGFLEEDVLAIEEQDARVLRFRFAPPRLERLAADDVRRDALVEEVIERLLVGDHVALARLVAQPLHLVE
jgi:hypothetical protein